MTVKAKPTEILTEFTIKQAAKHMGLTDAYVRALIRQKKLPSTLVPIAKDADVSRHIITLDDINEYERGATHKTKRKDGRNKFVFYATPTEAQAAVKVLQDAGLDLIASTVRTANILKPTRENHDV